MLRLVRTVLLHHSRNIYSIWIRKTNSTAEKKNITEFTDLVWHRRTVFGRNDEKYLKKADLSKEYTNHSIRATAVTVPEKSCFEARHVSCPSVATVAKVQSEAIARHAKQQRIVCRKSWPQQLRLPTKFQVRWRYVVKVKSSRLLSHFLKKNASWEIWTRLQIHKYLNTIHSTIVG